MKSKYYHLFLLLVTLAVLVWSGINPIDRSDWWLEIMPFLIAAPFIFGTYHKFRLSNLMYTLIAIHTIILAYGGHTTYELAPLGFKMQEWFGWTRNNYDKIGHLAQGLFPFIYVRELLSRTSPITRGRWLAFIAISVPLAILPSLNPNTTLLMIHQQRVSAVCVSGIS